MCDILEAVGGPRRGSIVINFGNHGDNPNKLTASTSSWVILSGWGQNGTTTTTDHMGHIAFIDANDPSDFKYRWVLPVIPLHGGTPTPRFPNGCCLRAVVLDGQLTQLTEVCPGTEVPGAHFAARVTRHRAVRRVHRVGHGPARRRGGPVR